MVFDHLLSNPSNSWGFVHGRRHRMGSNDDGSRLGADYVTELVQKLRGMSKLHGLQSRSPKRHTILVKSVLSGKTLSEHDIRDHSTARDLMNAITPATGIPEGQFRLLSGGEVLNEWAVLADVPAEEVTLVRIDADAAALEEQDISWARATALFFFGKRAS